MIRAHYFGALLLAMFLAACTSSQGPWMPAFVDPAYREAAFHSVAVLADTGDYAWRKSFESRVSAELIDAEVASAQASWFITPLAHGARPSATKPCWARASTPVSKGGSSQACFRPDFFLRSASRHQKKCRSWSACA